MNLVWEPPESATGLGLAFFSTYLCRCACLAILRISTRFSCIPSFFWTLFFFPTFHLRVFSKSFLDFGLCLFSDLRLCSCIESSIFFQSLFHDSAVLLSDPKTPRLFLYFSSNPFHNCLLSNLKSFDGFLFESSPPVFRFKKKTKKRNNLLFFGLTLSPSTIGF